MPFGDDAIDYLGLFSGGIPRVINAICDNALLIAFVQQSHEVRPEHVVEAAKDLALREADWNIEEAADPAPPPEDLLDPADLKDYLRGCCRPSSKGTAASPESDPEKFHYAVGNSGKSSH